MTNEIPRRRGTPAQRAIAARAIRSIRRCRSITGLHCLHHAADDLARTAAVRLDAGFTAEATDTDALPEFPSRRNVLAECDDAADDLMTRHARRL